MVAVPTVDLVAAARAAVALTTEEVPKQATNASSAAALDTGKKTLHFGAEGVKRIERWFGTIREE